MAPYGDIDPSQYWLRYRLSAWWHQAIAWTNVHFLSVMFCGIHLRIEFGDALAQLQASGDPEMAEIAGFWPLAVKNNNTTILFKHALHAY